jgi:hypothetical protein
MWSVKGGSLQVEASVTMSGRKPSRRARALRATVRAAGLGGLRGFSNAVRQKTQLCLARTDSSSHASASHKLLIQYHHLEHRFGCFWHAFCNAKLL